MLVFVALTLAQPPAPAVAELPRPAPAKWAEVRANVCPTRTHEAVRQEFFGDWPDDAGGGDMPRYVMFRSGPVAWTLEAVPGRVFVDYDAAGRIMGVEWFA